LQQLSTITPDISPVTYGTHECQVVVARTARRIKGSAHQI
jgi:hypothetical protein